MSVHLRKASMFVLNHTRACQYLDFKYFHALNNHALVCECLQCIGITTRVCVLESLHVCVYWNHYTCVCIGITTRVCVLESLHVCVYWNHYTCVCVTPGVHLLLLWASSTVGSRSVELSCGTYRMLTDYQQGC